jgi:hypothetical protein
MKLQLGARAPLRVRHFEQIDSRHRAGDVQQRIDPAKFCQGAANDALGCSGSHQIDFEHERLGALRPYLICSLGKARQPRARRARHQRNRGQA